MSSSPASILITGASLITPLGLSRQQTWEAVRAGQCGMGALSAMEQPLPPGRDGGQCPDLPDDVDYENPREVRYLRRAIRDALKDAGMEGGLPYPAPRCGILLGTTLHGMRAAGKFLRSNQFEFLADFLASSTLHRSAGELPISGLCATTCSACSSSLGSIAMAVSLLRSGQLDLVIAGGYDTISEYVYAGFNSLRLVAGGPLRPFTKGREGMKLAEGYGVVVLERAEDAQQRGHAALATILGYGESADAHHLTQPHPEGEGAARAMRAALESAGLTPGDIDLIAAHATGTPDNDAGEFAALSRVFGDDLSRVPLVAFKSHLGHTLGGAGAVELILSAMCLRGQVVPSCPNVRQEQIEFPNLRVATTSIKPARLRAALNTSLGFGGANTCMILAQPTAGRTFLSAIESASGGHSCPPEPIRVRSAGQTHVPHSRTPDRQECLPHSFQTHGSFLRDVFITGVGVVLPGAIGNEAFLRLLSNRNARITQDTGPIPEGDYLHLLNARRVRRMSDYVKLSLAATMLACQDAGVADLNAFTERCSAILGSTHGSTNYSEQYYRQIVTEGIPAANPMLFAEGVPNAAAAHLSLMLSLKGPCQTVIGSRTAGLDAVRLAATRIANGEWDRAIVGAAEEYSPIVNNAYKHQGLYAGTFGEPFGPETGFAAGSGAVTLILESARSLQERNAKPRGRLISSSGPVALKNGGSHHFSSKIGSRRGSPENGGSHQLLEVPGQAKYILSSANGTWLDRLEAIVLRSGAGPRVVSTLAGQIAETFSVTPLAGVAALLLDHRMPRLLGAAPRGDGLRGAAGDEHPERFAVLASDYTSLLTTLTVQCN